MLLILEPYDVSTANDKMIFGMNLVFEQRERKKKWKKWLLSIFIQVKHLLVIIEIKKQSFRNRTH